MQEPAQIVETYTEEDPEGAMSVVSVETSDDGTTRRTETTVGRDFHVLECQVLCGLLVEKLRS